MSNKTRVKSPIFSGDIFDRNLGEFAQREEYQAIKRQIARMGNLVESLAKVKENPDPEKPKSAMHLEYARTYERVVGDAMRSRDASIERLTEAQEKAYRQMLVKTKLDRTVPDAQEIRTHLRSMSEKERHQFIASSIDNGRYEVISAIANTSLPEMAGLTPSKVEQFQNSYIAKVAPEYLQEAKAFEAAGQMLGMAYESFKTSANNMRDQGQEADALRKKQEAEEAQAALQQALRSE